MHSLWMARAQTCRNKNKTEEAKKLAEREAEEKILKARKAKKEKNIEN